MNEETQKAWDIVEKTNANLFLTGKAGTGKTTFLKELQRRSPKRMVVLAPTGIAAINAGGMTIHSFFQLPLSPYLPGTTFGGADQKLFRFSKAKRNIIRTIDLLVIDEVSMVRSDLLDAIDSVLRRFRKQSNMPFGGVQLLLIGDLQQLSPVMTPQVEQLLKGYYDTPYFFSSKALTQTGYLAVELKEVFRQQDDQFVALLNQIRENKATDDTLQQLNQCYRPNFVPPKDSHYIRLTTHNHPAQRINEEQLAALPSPVSRFTAEVEGNFPETSYPNDYVLMLKPGAQVMFVKNDPGHRFYNGMIGEVRTIVGDQIMVESKESGEVFQLEQVEWTNAKYTLNETTNEIEETVEGVFRQYPIRLAWAITVHKSQGLTFERAIIDVSRSFTHGQTYVALSRCKTMEGMVLSQPLSRSAIISDVTIDHAVSQLQTPTAEQLVELERQYVVHCMDELFDFTSLRQACDLMVRCLADHFYTKHPLLLQAYQQMNIALQRLIDVALKFRQQYVGMLHAQRDVADVHLQDRIHKAAGYFSSEMAVLSELVRKTKVTTENKAAKKQFDERFATFSEEVMLKERLLQYEMNATFSVSDYLKQKANFLLIDDRAPNVPSGRRQSRSSKVAPTAKEPKVNTREMTYQLFAEGKSIAQIATERALTVGTIRNHLMAYIVEGKLNKRVLVSENHEKAIRQFMQTHPEASTYSDVREALGDDYEYHEIRLVGELMAREHGEQ